MRDPRLPPVESDALDFMDSTAERLTPLQDRGIPMTYALVNEAFGEALNEHAGTIEDAVYTTRDDGTETWPLSIAFADGSTLRAYFDDGGRMRVECHIPLTDEEKERLEEIKRREG